MTIENVRIRARNFVERHREDALVSEAIIGIFLPMLCHLMNDDMDTLVACTRCHNEPAWPEHSIEDLAEKVGCQVADIVYNCHFSLQDSTGESCLEAIRRCFEIYCMPADSLCAAFMLVMATAWAYNSSDYEAMERVHAAMSAVLLDEGKVKCDVFRWLWRTFEAYTQQRDIHNAKA